MTLLLHGSRLNRRQHLLPPLKFLLNLLQFLFVNLRVSMDGVRIVWPENCFRLVAAARAATAVSLQPLHSHFSFEKEHLQRLVGAVLALGVLAQHRALIVLSERWP